LEEGRIISSHREFKKPNTDQKASTIEIPSSFEVISLIQDRLYITHFHFFKNYQGQSLHKATEKAALILAAMQFIKIRASLPTGFESV
jgi:hypothetical protein